MTSHRPYMYDVAKQLGVAPGGSGPHDPDMEARVSVLEQIAKTTSDTLTEIKTDLRAVRDKQETDFRALSAKISSATLRLYIAGGAALAVALGVIAKGFHWL